jgi:8-amino-7-oxononanoate synthase
MTDAIQTADAPCPNPETVATAAPGRDLMSKFDGLIAERQALLDSGVTDPFAIVMDEVKSPTEAVIKGKDTILLGTYNYMGMTFDPDVIQAGKDALDQFGSGTNGSRMLNGTFRDHMEVEEALREFYGVSGDRLLDRLHGQSGHDLDARRQGRVCHPRRRQPRLDL